MNTLRQFGGFLAVALIFGALGIADSIQALKQRRREHKARPDSAQAARARFVQQQADRQMERD